MFWEYLSRRIFIGLKYRLKIDNEARISKKAEMKRKFNRNQKRIIPWDIQLSCLTSLVSSIWLVENQRFIRERTRRAKKVAWSSNFLRTTFSAKVDFFLKIQLVMRMLKGKKLYRSEKVSMLETGLKAQSEASIQRLWLAKTCFC